MVRVSDVPMTIIGLFIAALFVAIFTPEIVAIIAGTNTTTWSTTEIAFWTILPTIIVVGGGYMLIKVVFDDTL